jgi:hypothetical protein
MMHRASGIGAHFVDGANFASFGDDGLSSELAYLELLPLGLILRLRFIVSYRGVLVAWEDGAAFFLSAVGGAYLY